MIFFRNQLGDITQIAAAILGDSTSRNVIVMWKTELS